MNRKIRKYFKNQCFNTRYFPVLLNDRGKRDADCGVEMFHCLKKTPCKFTWQERGGRFLTPAKISEITFCSIINI